MCLDFHPSHTSLLAVGCYDGNVSVYDIRCEPERRVKRKTGEKRAGGKRRKRKALRQNGKQIYPPFGSDKMLCARSRTRT